MMMILMMMMTFFYRTSNRLDQAAAANQMYTTGLAVVSSHSLCSAFSPSLL